MTTTTTTTTTTTMIQTLQNLRLLPPPCNELVPMLMTICSFTAISLIAGAGSGNENLQVMWEGALERLLLLWFNDNSWTGGTIENIFLVGSFVIYMTMYWGYSLLIHTIEHIFPKTLSNFKIQPETPIASWTEVGTMVPLVLFNQVFLGLPMLKALLAWLNHREINLVSVPSIPNFVGLMVVQILCTELWFYSVHRTLHTSSFLYKHVHSIHHYYKAPSCVESVYVHPIEFVLNSFGAIIIGPAITGAPLLVFLIWIGLVTFLQVHDHSGYWFPFLPRVLMHDYHHQQIQCCYGLLGLMDGILGTEKNFHQFVKDHEDSSCRTTTSCPTKKSQ